MQNNLNARLARSLAIAVAGVILMSQCPAIKAASNSEIAAVCEADQGDRKAVRPGELVDWPAVRIRDADRRGTMRRMLEEGEIRSADDFYCAALVFQHGESLDDIRLAFALSTIATNLKQPPQQTRFLQAAAWDRMMLRANRPQWYGTQFVRDPVGGGWVLYEVDESVLNDAQRREAGVPTLAEARQRALDLNRKRD